MHLHPCSVQPQITVFIPFLRHACLEASASLARGNANVRSYESGMAHEHREAISLALKDIQEAIAEVKTKTVRSPYTPEEPAEPIWVMRKEHSPMEEMENNIGGFEVRMVNVSLFRILTSQMAEL